MAINIYFWILTLSALGYLLVILLVTVGWYRTKSNELLENIPGLKVSVVVAVRNEEKNIEHLLKDIARQDYSKEDMEIILVNDNSEDKTVEVIERFMAEWPRMDIKLFHSGKEGKKAALLQGIENAKGELIVTTDGDCRMEPLWLGRMVAFYKKDDCKLIIGPVVYQNEKSINQKFFSLDFMSLVAAGAGSVGIGLPFMGNGANLAFEREAWLTISSGTGGKQFVSGDDVFLIQGMVKYFGAPSVRFLKDPSTIVTTNPPENFREFLSQRIRWASKAKGYRMLWPVLVSSIVFLFNVFVVSIFLATIFKPWFFLIFCLFVLLKMMTDFPLLKNFTSFAGKRKLLSMLFPFEFIYPFYIVVAAFTALFFRFEWKGRSGLR